ncbi:MAG: hypothetical protein ABR509_02690 [Candidatus Limnocylindria bacterium]
MNEDRGSDALSIAIAVILAALGLAGALIAWRVGDASNRASDATQEGVIAARARSAEEITADGLVAQTMEAWLEYERARRRAESLQRAGFADQALGNAMQAAAHWFLVRPEYLDDEGNYDPRRHRESYLAEAVTRRDLDPTPHYARAAAEESRVRSLLLIAVLLATALPLLTMAGFTGGRLRVGATAIGGAIFAVGTVLRIVVWL